MTTQRKNVDNEIDETFNSSLYYPSTTVDTLTNYDKESFDVMRYAYDIFKFPEADVALNTGTSGNTLTAVNLTAQTDDDTFDTYIAPRTNNTYLGSYSAGVVGTDFTVSFWTRRVTDTLSNSWVATFTHTSGPYFLMNIGWHDSNEIKFVVSDNIDPYRYTSPTPLPLNTWIHIVVQFGTQGTKVYIDNVLEDSSATAYSPSGSVVTYLIGFRPQTPFTADIAEFAVFNRVLEPFEITHLYNRKNTVRDPEIECGALQLVDGNQATNSLMVSDASGNASWSSSISVSALQLTTSPGVDYVLRSDATGNATWFQRPVAYSFSTTVSIASGTSTTVDLGTPGVLGGGITHSSGTFTLTVPGIYQFHCFGTITTSGLTNNLYIQWLDTTNAVVVGRNGPIAGSGNLTAANYRVETTCIYRITGTTDVICQFGISGGSGTFNALVGSPTLPAIQSITYVSGL